MEGAWMGALTLISFSRRECRLLSVGVVQIVNVVGVDRRPLLFYYYYFFSWEWGQRERDRVLSRLHAQLQRLTLGSLSQP